MQYIVTDGGVQLFDDDYKPIALDVALATVRRVAAAIEAIGNEPKRDGDTTAPVDKREEAESAGAMAARSEG